jgi:hypothetical protein
MIRPEYFFRQHVALRRSFSRKSGFYWFVPLLVFFSVPAGLPASFFFLKYSRFASLIACRLRRCKFRLAF